MQLSKLKEEEELGPLLNTITSRTLELETPGLRID